MTPRRKPYDDGARDRFTARWPSRGNRRRSRQEYTAIARTAAQVIQETL